MINAGLQRVHARPDDPDRKTADLLLAMWAPVTELQRCRKMLARDGKRPVASRNPLAYWRPGKRISHPVTQRAPRGLK